MLLMPFVSFFESVELKFFFKIHSCRKIVFLSTVRLSTCSIAFSTAISYGEQVRWWPRSMVRFSSKCAPKPVENDAQY